MKDEANRIIYCEQCGEIEATVKGEFGNFCKTCAAMESCYLCPYMDEETGQCCANGPCLNESVEIGE